MTCKHCGAETVAYEDQGIGPYEWWGYKGNDTHMMPVCGECGEPLEGADSYEEHMLELRYYEADRQRDEERCRT